MKPTEFMIGDWYYWKAEGKKYPLQVTKETFALADEDIANFQSIPITPEILENNGFIGKIAISGSSIYFYPLNDKVYLYKNGVYAIGKNVWQDIYLTNCEYVHQLQHILKDLQIEKEIVI